MYSHTYAILYIYIRTILIEVSQSEYNRIPTTAGNPDVPKENEAPPIANKVDYFFTTLSRAIEKLGENGEPTAAEKETIRAQKNMADYYEYMMAKEKAKDL